MVFLYIARREILTLGEGFNTQVITLWCFYIVGREISTLGEGFNTQVITLWCFYIVDSVFRRALPPLRRATLSQGTSNSTRSMDTRTRLLYDRLWYHSKTASSLRSDAPPDCRWNPVAHPSALPRPSPTIPESHAPCSSCRKKA